MTDGDGYAAGLFLPGSAPLALAGWRRLLLPALSLLVLVAALDQFGRIDWHGADALLPRSPGTVLLFAAFYLAGPVADWAIFRRLWQLPPAGFLALVRKAISNELLLGYSGELYFYGWARRRLRLAGAPFGAVKDVAILSAAVGNAVTLLLLAASWPRLGALGLGLSGHLFAASIGTVALSSLAALALRRSLFSLPAHALREIAGLHLLRVIASTALLAALWHALVPAAPLVWWLVLATLRLLVSRLPFVPNKDLTFAAVAAFAMGGRGEVADLVAAVAAAVLATHVVLGATFALADIAGVGRSAEGEA